MRRSRQILAVLVVATALCAERSFALASSRPTASSPTPAGSSFAGRLLDRLSSGLKGVVRVRLPDSPERPERVRTPIVAAPFDQAFDRDHIPVMPFRFRLPPPSMA
jgi:hypothetical protein